MAKKTRKNYSAAQKAEILRRHIKGKEAVSDLCDEFGLQPSQVYRWLEQLLGNAEVALDTRGAKRSSSAKTKLQRENEALRNRLAKRDHVIAELSEEYVELKKSLGES